MKRFFSILCVCVLLAALAAGGLLAARKAHTMYKGVWDTLDHLTLVTDELAAGQSRHAEALSTLATQANSMAQQIGYLHRQAQSLPNTVSDWVDSVPPYIAHACGGIDGQVYTNSREAFLHQYARGQRVFEIDFNLANDGVLIACHSEDDWRRMTGSALPYESRHFDEQPLCGQYESLNAQEVIELLADHPDAYIITDTKDTTQAEVMLAFSQLVYLAQKTHPEVLARIIPQIYNEDMLPWVEAVYPFPSIIYTLYQVAWTPESVLDFCMNSGVRFITMPQDQVTEEALRLWDTLGIRVGVHTVNDPLQAQQLFDLGVDMLYTDFLTPADAPL